MKNNVNGCYRSGTVSNITDGFGRFFSIFVCLSPRFLISVPTGLVVGMWEKYYFFL